MKKVEEEIKIEEKMRKLWKRKNNENSEREWSGVRLLSLVPAFWDSSSGYGSNVLWRWGKPMSDALHVWLSADCLKQ